MIFHLILLTFCAIENTHARLLTLTENFPATDTDYFTHGFCVTGAIEAQAKSDLETLTYSVVDPFVGGTVGWSDRTYKYSLMSNSRCAGGMLLKPSKYMTIARGTVIDITTVSDGSSVTEICAILIVYRNGGWPSSLINMGFIEYENSGLGLVSHTFVNRTLFCKTLTKQKRCDELYVLEGFALTTDTTPLSNPAPKETIIASYNYNGNYPIVTGVYGITNIISYVSICTIIESNMAPKCDVEMNIEFCKVSNCKSTTMSGKFMASGTGPDPYVINGGTGDLFAAQGTIDSKLQNARFSLNLLDVKVNLCFSNKVH